MNELWKDIKDYEGIYQISNFGNVKSLGVSDKKIYKRRRLGWSDEEIINGKERE